MDFMQMSHLVSDFSQRYEAIENEDGTITLIPRRYPAAKLDAVESTFKTDSVEPAIGYNDLVVEVAQDLYKAASENAWKPQSEKRRHTERQRYDGIKDAVKGYADTLQNAWR